MNKAEFKGLKGAGITILWAAEKMSEPFTREQFMGIYTDKTIDAAIECLLGSKIITEQDDGYVVSKKYIKAAGIIPSPTTTRYINNIVNVKKNINSSRSELFRDDIYILLKGVGIGEPKLSKLSELQHATEYFTGYIADWEERRKTDKRIRVGMLIRMLESGIEPAKDPDAYDSEKYTEGKYKDFIK